MNKRIGGGAAGVLALLGVLAGDAQATFGGLDCGSGNRKVPYYSWYSGLRVVGLTDDGKLVCFSERWPDREKQLGHVSGFTGSDTALVGIDFRVQDGLLYGVGNAGGVYTVDTTTAVLTFVNQLTVPLSGSAFGVDFNPAADRLRIVSDTGQNLRHNVNSGGMTIADTTLSYTPPTAAAGIVGAGYTNNDLDVTTATTLFDIDSALDQVAVQSPANSGMLAPTGKLTVDTTPEVGFDVYSDLRGGVTTSNRGFASLGVNDVSAFYAVNLLTGRAKFLGTFDQIIVDIAVPLDQ
jgi:hypothetical protein